ncbi:DUF7507 domain-containing protein [Flavobacterium anhuiense]|uniref:Ig-like domain-containing protein n=1 Tax=Flavobacterium anhuiense TaxID=459526 RepID=UPI003D996111
MKNKIKNILAFIALLLVTSVSAQTNYSFSIADILSSMPNGKRLPDGTVVKAELITTGGATHTTGASGSGTPGPDIGGLFTGITLPAYVGDHTPTNFTKIQMANTLNADNGMGNNCASSIGFRIYFDRPIESINFLALDIDGVHATPNGNAEWVGFFGYNGNTFVPYAINGPTTELTDSQITIGAGHSWRNLITNSLGAAAAANLPTGMTIRRQTRDGGPGTPDDLNHQVLFTPPSSTTHVTDFFLMMGIWSVTGQANVQASGLSPIVITISSDFGDAPDSYKTLLASGGPSHGVVGTLLLGATNFSEPDGLPSVLADASIDDDGVLVIPPITNNGQTISSYTVAANFTNNTGLPANYVAWIDWNNNGVFEASEGATATTPAGTLSGSVNLTWNNVALTNTAGHAQTYLRVRVTTEAITTSDFGGAFINGEVEDYAIGIPAATPDFACFNVGSSSGFIDVLANDTTGNTIVPETLGLVDPGNGTNLIIDGFGDIVGITIAGEGTWKANSAGQVSFEPVSASVISPTPMAYLGRDAQGNTSNSALITLTAASMPVNTTTVTAACFPNTLTATASVPAGQSVVWYDAAVGGNVVASPVLSTVGTITYYAQGNNGTCTSARTPITLTITAPPIPGNLSGTQNICQGSTTAFTTDGAAGGTWSSSDTTIATVDGSGIVTGVLPGTASITYTAIGSGGCLDVSSTRTITIEDATDSGILSGNQSICVSGNSTFTSNGATGGTWSSDNLAIATVDASSGVVVGISRGTTTIRYTIPQVGSCPVIPSTIAVTIIESNPGILSGNQNVCVGETTTFTTDGDSGGDWTSDNSGIATVDANGVITGNSTGTAIITYTVNSTSGCPSASTTRTVTVNVNSSATEGDIIVANAEICPGGTAVLNVSSVTVTNPIFTWYADQTTTTVLNTGASYSVSPASTTTYYVSVKGDAVCENDPTRRQSVTVTINTLGVVSDINASDATICLGSAALLTASSSTVTTPIFRWYADQTSTTILSTGPSYSPSPLVNTTYYVSVSGDGVCENIINTRKPVVVTVNPLATQADITANNRTICNGSPIVLTANSSNVISPVFRWYADQITTTILNTGPSYSVSPLSTTTYYVSVAGTGICENAPSTRKAVTVNVNPLAQASDVVITDVTTCPGEGVILTASSTTVTAPIFRWYVDQTSTTVLSTGTTYSPSPTVTTTYYVSVSGTGVCENAINTRKPVTVTMNPLATAADINISDQTVCEGSPAVLIPTTTIDSPVFIWYLSQTSTNPLFIGNEYNPTPPVTTTYYLSVRGTNVCENAINTRKPVTVTVNSLAVATDITVSDSTICNGSTASLTASSTTVTTPVFNWYADQTTTAALSTGATYSPSPTFTTTYYVGVSGDGVCENLPDTRQEVTVTVNSLGLASDITVSDATICNGSAASLTASSTTVTTPVFNWYADQTTTTALSTGATYSPSPTVTTTYYVGVSGDGVCENLPGTRQLVTVTVNSLGLASDITASDATICNGSAASLTASSTTVTTPVFNWYADQTTTTVLSTGATYSPSPTATTTYYVGVSGDGVCENLPGTRQAVTVTVNSLAVASDITVSDATICNGSAASLTASSTTVTTPVFNWYADQTTTAALSTGATYSPSPTATTTYYVGVSGDGVCENLPGTRQAVMVTVNSLGLASDITVSDATICNGSAASLTASSTTVTTPVFNWYADQTTTTALSTGATYSPSPTATTTYYVGVSGDGVCENLPGTRQEVTVTVNSLGLASDITVSDATICNGSAASLTAFSTTVTTPVFNWYADQTTTTALSTGATYSPSPTATTTYYVGVSGDGVCENLPGTRQAVTVTVNSLGLASDITVSDATICSSSAATLTASSTTVTTPVFIWYADQTTTTALSTGATYNPSPTVTTTYYVSVSGDGVCENLPGTRQAVTVTVNSLGLASDITVSDATICLGSSASLTASSATVTTPVFIWYADQTTTTALSTGATYNPSPTIITTYYVSVSGDGVCENLPNTRKPVTVTVNSLGIASDITVSDATICSGSSASLLASSATVTTPVFIWYADQTTTTALSTGASYSPSPTATTTYYVSVSGDGVCENLPGTRQAVTVTVNSLGLASDITAADATICSGSSVSLTASTVTVTTPVFRWYADQTTTTVLSTGVTYSPSPTATTTYYVSVSGDGVCENFPNTRKPVTVTVNALGLALDITAADATICNGSSVSLTASSATVTTPIFTWYADQTTTTALSTGASYNPTPTITTTYYVSVSGDGVCENLPNTRKPVTVTVNSLAVASDITATLSNATICTRSTSTITASSTVSNAIYNWYQDANLSVLLYTGAVFVTPSLTANTSYYVTVHSDAVCENTIGNALKVDVNVILCSDIALTKTASNLSPYVGDRIDFTITVTNFGSDNATGVSAKDVLPSGYTFISADSGGTLAGNTITWPVLNIVAGASVPLKYTVRINASLGVADEYKNVAQIITSDNFDPNSTPNNNDPTENDQDSEIVTPIVPSPSIQVFKDGVFTATNDTNGDGFPEAGETITYTFSVRNTGNIRLENVKINDSYIGVANLTITPSTLEPGQIGNGQVIYTITQTDIDNGVIYNSAIGQGNTPPTVDDPDGTVVNDTSTDPTNPSTSGDPYYDPLCPDCTVVPLPNNPKIAIVKEIASFSGDLNNAKAGDVISYLFTVTNVGNTVLTNVRVNDPMPGLSTPTLDSVNTATGTGDLNANGSLDLIERWLYRADYTITTSDIAKGQVVNQAVAEATGPPTPIDPTGKEVSDLSDGSSPTDNGPTVLDIKGCQVIAHNALSPNGDSKNDTFKIDGIECYPQNTVEIYNRWGVIVFHTNGYDNASNVFNGYSNGRAVVKQSAGLPTGTYYYIIKYVDSDSKEQSSAGYLYLSMQ